VSAQGHDAFVAILTDRDVLEAGLIERGADAAGNIGGFRSRRGAARQNSDERDGQQAQALFEYCHIFPLVQQRSTLPKSTRRAEGELEKQLKSDARAEPFSLLAQSFEHFLHVAGVFFFLGYDRFQRSKRR
jgi:hypothetical protein